MGNVAEHCAHLNTSAVRSVMTTKYHAPIAGTRRRIFVCASADSGWTVRHTHGAGTVIHLVAKTRRHALAVLFASAFVGPAARVGGAGEECVAARGRRI